MKKSNFVALILGTIGVVFFALGMCMCTIEEWGMFDKGIISGIIGLAVLLITVIVWRRMEGKTPVQFNAKVVVSVLVGVLGALLLGVGMCLCMVAVAAGKRPIDILEMTYSQHALIGSGGYLPEDVQDVMAVMASGTWDIESIITNEYPWEQLPQAIEKASHVEEALNVIIRYGQ